MAIENTFIYLIGFAGTGKLTIAKELQKIVPSILVDNHLILNVLFSLIDVDGVTPLPRAVWDNARIVRDVVLDTIRNLSRPNRNFIFTNELREGDTIDLELFEEIAELARDRGASLLPVRLLISPEELCRRIVSEERRAKFKAVDAEKALVRAQQNELLRPPGHQHFDLDVTALAAEESARQIAAELERRQTL